MWVSRGCRRKNVASNNVVQLTSSLVELGCDNNIKKNGLVQADWYVLSSTFLVVGGGGGFSFFGFGVYGSIGRNSLCVFYASLNMLCYSFYPFIKRRWIVNLFMPLSFYSLILYFYILSLSWKNVQRYLSDNNQFCLLLK